jgi:hypothetical protein
VVAELQSPGKITDGRAVAFPSEAFYRQQQLMLLRFEPIFPRRILAEIQELANLVAKLGESPIL